MKQDLFNFDDEEKPPAKKYSWTWKDPLPEGLTDRQWALMMIKRAVRQLEEAEEKHKPALEEALEELRTAYRRTYL